jgi:diguanylate cyclase (GGDEF)-like protein
MSLTERPGQLNFAHTSIALDIARSTTPVSEFYDRGGRFFVARPIENDETISGYIILEADTAIITDYISRTTRDDNTVFAVFDESRTVIGYGDNSGGTLERSIDDYFSIEVEDMLDEDGRFARNRYYGAIGTITGTRWRWLALEPYSNTTNSTWAVFGIALAVAAGISAVNLGLLLRFSRKMFAPLVPIAQTLEKARESLCDTFEEARFDKLDFAALGISPKSDFAAIIQDANSVLEESETAHTAASTAASESADFKQAYDCLTGLYDRRTFEQMLNELLTHSPNAANAAVMLAEIGNFKAVCTKFGHKAGDELVLFAVEKLCNTIKAVSQDSFAGRFGGCAFALCVAECPNGTDSTDSAEQICAYLAEELRKGYFSTITDTKMSVTVSIGVAANNNEGIPAKTLIARADESVYLAKKNFGKSTGKDDKIENLPYYVYKSDGSGESDEEIENILSEGEL